MFAQGERALRDRFKDIGGSIALGAVATRSYEAFEAIDYAETA